MKRILIVISALLSNILAIAQTNGPWTHSVYRAYSIDGSNFERDTNLLFFPASVPDAVMDTNETVFLYYVKMESPADTEKLMVASSFEGEYFGTPQLTNFSGSTVTRRVDPCAILLDDGRIRLYYIDFDMQPPQDVHSAISDDGINFTEEPGVRFSDPSGITDPDVFDVSGRWNMYLSKGMQLIRTTSIDGLDFVIDTNFIWNSGAVSSTLQVSCGLYKTYYCGNGIQPAYSPNGDTLVPENVTCFQSYPNEIVCDPSVIRMITGHFYMYFKSASVTSVGDYPSYCCSEELQNYPNPFDDYTNINIPEKILPYERLKVEIYNYLGGLVSMQEFETSDQITIDRTGLSNGVYSYILRSEKGFSGSGKMIIK